MKFSRHPSLGFGLTLKPAYIEEILTGLQSSNSIYSKVDCFEAVAENFIDPSKPWQNLIIEISKIKPVILHCVGLSIGSADDPKEQELEAVADLARKTKAHWVTDHLSFSSFQNKEFNTLLPLPFSSEAVDYTVDRIKEFQKYFDIPFGIENPSAYCIWPESEMKESEFLTKVAEGADCCILLDLNNLVVNSYNHDVRSDKSYETSIELAKKFLTEIPLDRVVEIHVAGHSERKGQFGPYLFDTHGATPQPAVIEVVKHFSKLRNMPTVILERDNHIPPIPRLIDELHTVKAMALHA